MARTTQCNFKMLKIRLGMSGRAERERLIARVNELPSSQDATALFADAPARTGKTVSCLAPALVALPDTRVNQVVISTGGPRPLRSESEETPSEGIRGIGLRNVNVARLEDFQSCFWSEKATDELLLGGCRSL